MKSNTSDCMCLSSEYLVFLSLFIGCMQVTVSLALSIVAVLGTFWTLLHVTPDFAHVSYHPHYEMLEDNITEIEIMTWATHYEVILYQFIFFVSVVWLILSCFCHPFWIMFYLHLFDHVANFDIQYKDWSRCCLFLPSCGIPVTMSFTEGVL